MSFVELFDVIKTWAAGNLPATVGALVGVLALIFLVTNAALARRRRGLSARVAAGGPTNEKALSWTPPEQSYADRRGSARREGAPVRVVLASNTLRNGTGDGYVIDRSTGGLKLAAQAAVPPGTTVQVRAVGAPDTIGFVTVIVRSCRKNADFYELGCEFEKTPPWNVLLLFG